MITNLTTHRSTVTDKPSPPNNLKLKAVTDTTATLQWAPPDNTGGCDITAYVVEKREGARRMWQTVGTTPAGQCEAYIPKLVEGKEYSFCVRAQNRVGTSEPAELRDLVIPKSQFGKSSFLGSATETSVLVSSSKYICVMCLNNYKLTLALVC